MSVTDEGPGAVEGAGGPSALRFRIFKRGAWRRAFRLEDVFWDALEGAAQDEQKKLGDFVKQITDTSAPDANISSLMRVRAMEWLNERCKALDLAQSPQMLLPAVLAVPVPCFVISASRELVASNADFTTYVTARQRPSGDSQTTKVHMSLDVPVQKLLDTLTREPGKSATCGFSIRTPGAVLLGRAKLSLLHPARRDLLVGYVLEDGKVAARG
jgi:predicted DNA-binding ribbon-helix-helix protein